MKFTLPKDVFPTLILSQDVQNALINEADTVVKEIVVAGEAYIREGSKLEHSYWKHVRTKEGLRVFRQRKSTINQRSLGSCSPVIQSPSWTLDPSLLRYGASHSSDRQMSVSTNSGICEDSIMERMRPRGVSLMALHGTIDGTLDDCMLGCFTPTNEAWMLRSSHINDRLDDARILATIRGATRQDPCRFLGVKWFAKEHPVILTGIVQQRDFLILESSGFTRDSKGERLGYFLVHSVTLREIPELSHLGIVRGLMSFCYLFRQGGPGKVDVFCRGFFDSRGGVPNRLSVAIAADAAICCANVVDLAYIKKLRYLVNKNAHKHITSHSDKTRPRRCQACDKSLTKFLLPVSEMGTTCQICHHFICTKCSVAKKITVDVSDTGAVQQCFFHFCVSCLMKAKQYSSWEMAVNDFEALSKSLTASCSSSASGLPPTPQTVTYTRSGRSYSTCSGTRCGQ
ncbi:unnamed protein product [Peronospora belbahrii]|uniref:FYVE-type domain-containing protein n=1 Tax=Peronospora belbahrii TaxID=622444 RepID=A0AAU9KRW6_9STRA|nr:unnamed protein product [Peronospora belbahrii]CAH0515648.1 unnamed protein product [Peronospora belbahrii]